MTEIDPEGRASRSGTPEDAKVVEVMGEEAGVPPDLPGVRPSSFLPVRRRGRWILIGSVVGVVASFAWLFAFAMGRDPSIIGSPLIGRQAPDFALRTLDGPRVVRLSSLRGQVVVVNFWASWCAACREEHPALLAAWQRYQDHDVVFIGIDFQDRKQPALAFVREMGGDWPVVDDPGGRTALAYGLAGVPETFFIDSHGVIRHKQIGPSSYAVLTDHIERLLEARD